MVEEITGAGGRAAFHRLDVADRDGISEAVGAIEAAHGPVDVLVNGAGIIQAAIPLEDFGDDENDKTWEINYRGTYLCCRYFGMAMARRHRGAIVNIASVAGLRGMPTLAYGPSKSAIVALTESLGVELGRRGVRVNAVAPGPVATPAMLLHFQAGTRDPTVFKENTALNRLTMPEEIADGIYFLASDKASAITGITLPIDCGLLAGGAWILFGGIKHELEG